MIRPSLVLASLLVLPTLLPSPRQDESPGRDDSQHKQHVDGAQPMVFRDDHQVRAIFFLDSGNAGCLSRVKNGDEKSSLENLVGYVLFEGEQEILVKSARLKRENEAPGRIASATIEGNWIEFENIALGPGEEADLVVLFDRVPTKPYAILFDNSEFSGEDRR